MAEDSSQLPPNDPDPSASPEPSEVPLGPLAWAWGRVLYYRRVIGDIAVTMVPQLVSVLSGLVTSILIARGLGPVGMGKYALIMSVCGLVAQLSDLGIGTTGVRYASRAVADDDETAQFAVLRWAFRLRIVLTAAMSLIALLVVGVVTARLWHSPDLAPYVRWSLLLGLCYALANVPYIYFQAHQRFAVAATVQVLQTLLSLCGIVLLAALHHWSLGAVIGVSIVAAAAGSLAFLSIVPRQALLGPTAAGPDVPRWAAWFQPPHVGATSTDTESVGAFAGLMVLASTIVGVTMRLDIWIMGALLPQAQVGVYQVAGRFTVPLVVLLGSMTTALLPRASALENRADLARLAGRTAKLTCLASGVGLLWTLIGPPLAPWLFGTEYAAAAGIARLLCLRYVLALVTAPLGVIGYSFGLMRVLWRVNLAQLAVVVLLNMYLQPRIGPVGAAWALIANEILGSTVIAALLWRACRRYPQGNTPQQESEA